MSEKSTKGVQILRGDPEKSACKAFNSHDDRNVSSDDLQLGRWDMGLRPGTRGSGGGGTFLPDIHGE